MVGHASNTGIRENGLKRTFDQGQTSDENPFAMQFSKLLSFTLRLMADKLKTCKYNRDSVQCITIASFSEVKAEGPQRFLLYQGFYLFQLHG